MVMDEQGIKWMKERLEFVSAMIQNLEVALEHHTSEAGRMKTQIERQRNLRHGFQEALYEMQPTLNNAPEPICLATNRVN